LDKVAGTTGPGTADSSARFENRPGYRASSAFDGDPATAWVGQWIRGKPAWLSWTTDRTFAVRRLRLIVAPFVARTPREVSLNGRRASVGADGAVTFATPVRSRRFRLDLVKATFPGGTPARVRQRRAVAIGELRTNSGTQFAPEVVDALIAVVLRDAPDWQLGLAEPPSGVEAQPQPVKQP